MILKIEHLQHSFFQINSVSLSKSIWRNIKITHLYQCLLILYQSCFSIMAPKSNTCSPIKVTKGLIKAPQHQACPELGTAQPQIVCLIIVTGAKNAILRVRRCWTQSYKARVAGQGCQPCHVTRCEMLVHKMFRFMGTHSPKSGEQDSGIHGLAGPL